jgi:hypothetical protein
MGKDDIKKLKESIPTTGMKIIDLYNKIDNDLLDTQPNYQRKLVWKKQHKYAFIDTILLNFPFPEVYIASSDIDVVKMVATEVVVDGQQRLTTIVDYIKGEGDFASQTKVINFNDLEAVDKKSFLNYKVSVRDLKDIGEDIIKEIFQRINSTEYSLNTVEKNNALFGDGEIAMFCKQLVDRDYNVSEDTTDIVLDSKSRTEINDFFGNNKIFTDNDKKRMYDFQYLMLITSTILEGNYYGRSTKVEDYLDKFNSSFEDYEKIQNLLLKSIRIIDKLEFPLKSYWFNKANIFTLIVEISKVDDAKLDTKILERELLSLEDKVDLYFTAEEEDELEYISEDEKKYFEVARHGSHEKASREHRGKVIENILKISMQETKAEGLEVNNLKYLESNKIGFSVLIPTKTGLTKSIMDAVTDVRDFLKNNNIHDYSSQDLGPTAKVKKNCLFDYKDESVESEISLYRSNGRGDYRIWFSGLNDFANPNDKLALTINQDGIINLLNISKIDYSN